MNTWATIYVVLEGSDVFDTDVYGIFNTEDEAKQFVEWRAQDDLADELTIKTIVAATRHGLL